ncbi:MAG: hypothetical protein RLZ53_1059, partial [Actinomycetota bacterium]
DEKERDLNQTFNEVIGSVQYILDQETAALNVQAGVLRSLSPQGTLDRGYSVVRDKDGHVILDGTKVKAGTTLNIRLAKGEIQATSN